MIRRINEAKVSSLHDALEALLATVNPQINEFVVDGGLSVDETFKAKDKKYLKAYENVVKSISANMTDGNNKFSHAIDDVTGNKITLNLELGWVIFDNVADNYEFYYTFQPEGFVHVTVNFNNVGLTVNDIMNHLKK